MCLWGTIEQRGQNLLQGPVMTELGWRQLGSNSFGSTTKSFAWDAVKSLKQNSGFLKISSGFATSLSRAKKSPPCFPSTTITINNASSEIFPIKRRTCLALKTTLTSQGHDQTCSLAAPSLCQLVLNNLSLHCNQAARAWETSPRDGSEMQNRDSGGRCIITHKDKAKCALPKCEKHL